jgi:hypothetical protein
MLIGLTRNTFQAEWKVNRRSPEGKFPLDSEWLTRRHRPVTIAGRRDHSTEQVLSHVLANLIEECRPLSIVIYETVAYEMVQTFVERNECAFQALHGVSSLIVLHVYIMPQVTDRLQPA